MTKISDIGTSNRMLALASNAKPGQHCSANSPQTFQLCVNSNSMPASMANTRQLITDICSRFHCCQHAPLMPHAIEHNILPSFHENSACLTSKFTENASVYLTHLSLLIHIVGHYYASKLRVRMRKVYLHMVMHALTIPEVRDGLAWAGRGPGRLKVAYIYLYI